VHYCLTPYTSYKLTIDHPHTQAPFHFYKGKKVFSDKYEDEEPYDLNRESLCQPTHNMMTSHMVKDLDLWMSLDLCYFNRYKFCENYTSGLELEEKHIQYVNTLPFIPFVNITFSSVLKYAQFKLNVIILY